ncbi:ABC transporter permease [Tessaracoccus sp. ZS01]|uniref:ABC transporter permease n=1 Tax=Tessaracoccus sp. ZS01 TaxID=1906324 RepID=UPI00096CC498|nr:ABC transporter permease [Tessaracoccus sp. ZS01]MCG6566830.1 ABC transporter permease [Tessaracoccus sp. ZS01]OMG57969.1 hypothetical protein BJN44_04190 [Tessaracoccus sp. ZS01]
MNATVALFRNEVRMFARTPGVVVWMALPILAAIVIAAIPAARQPNEAFGGLSVSQAYTPTLTMFVISMTGLVLLPQVLGDYRELGFLRRLRTTPATVGNLLKAFLAVMVVLSLGAALIIAVTPLFFGVGGAVQPVRYALAVVLSTAAFLALGTVLCALIPSPKAASGIGTAVAATQWFAAGMWFPRALFPDWLTTVSNLMPGGAATQLMTDAMFGVSTSPASGWVASPATSVIVCLVWAVIGIAVALKTFRWE